MNYISEAVGVADYSAPASNAAGAVNGNAVNCKDKRTISAVVFTGVLGTSATVDFKLQYSVDGSTNWTDISTASLTQLVKASHDNKVAILSINAGRVWGLYSAQYIRGVMTVGTAASICGFMILFGDARYEPVKDFDSSVVVEIKNVAP